MHMRTNKINLPAKQFRVNVMEEQAEATEELVATLTENHTHQMETLIKSTTNAMKEMMALIKSENKNLGNPINATNEEKKKKRDEKCKKYSNAPICSHCGKKHPAKKEDECWGLEQNKASRPDN
jgi:hypothetical protein